MSDTATRFYDHPIWYDILHDRDTAWEVGFLKRMAAKWVTTDQGGPLGKATNQYWLEPACGSGRFLRYLAKRNVRVLGYDINERAIQYAQRKLARQENQSTAIIGSMTEFCQPRTFDFAFNTINTFRHLMSEKEALHHLHLIAESLKPGGVYFVGLDVVEYDVPEPMEETWVVNKAGCEVTQVMMTIPPEKEKRLERIINHITVRTRNREFYYESTYDLYTYSIRQWVRLIEKSPFEMVDAYDFLHQPIEINEHSRDVNAVLRLRD